MHTDLHENHQATYKAKNIAFGTSATRSMAPSTVKPSTSGSFLSTRLDQGVSKFAHQTQNSTNSLIRNNSQVRASQMGNHSQKSASMTK
jgi:hypothetical protein